MVADFGAKADQTATGQVAQMRAQETSDLQNCNFALFAPNYP